MSDAHQPKWKKASLPVDGRRSKRLCLQLPIVSLRGQVKPGPHPNLSHTGFNFIIRRAPFSFISKFPPEALDRAVLDLNFAKGMQGKVRYSSFGAVTGTFSKNQEPLCIAVEAREILQPVNAE